MSDEVAFYRTRAGRTFYDSTLPELVQAIQRLTDAVAGDKLGGTVQELVDASTELAQTAERVLDVAIVPGSAATQEAFAQLRASTSAVRRVLAKLR